MQVFLQFVSFSLQTDGSGWLVLTKGKCPQYLLHGHKQAISIFNT